MRCEVWATSVWGTFSASLHLVHEKLEQVLQDTPTEEWERGMWDWGMDSACARI